MARDILSQYGPDAMKTMRPRAKMGGVTMDGKRDVMNYKPPYGPTNINDPQGPGLHQFNYGCGQRPMAPMAAGGVGKVGLGGRNLTNAGQQRGGKK